MVSVACTYEISLRFEVSWLKAHECTDLSNKERKERDAQFHSNCSYTKKGEEYTHTHTLHNLLRRVHTLQLIRLRSFSRSFVRVCEHRMGYQILYVNERDDKQIKILSCYTHCKYHENCITMFYAQRCHCVFSLQFSFHDQNVFYSTFFFLPFRTTHNVVD